MLKKLLIGHIKGGCTECKVKCLYNLNILQNAKLRPKQKDIREELVRHSHACYRNIKDGTIKRSASTQEQCDELIDHYTYSHNV